MSKTRLSSAYLGNIIHKFYNLGGKVIVNSTINLEDTPTTRNRNIPQMLQRQMIQVIQSHTNNIGDSALYVDGPLNPIPDVSDILTTQSRWEGSVKRVLLITATKEAIVALHLGRKCASAWVPIMAPGARLMEKSWV